MGWLMLARDPSEKDKASRRLMRHAVTSLFIYLFLVGRYVNQLGKKVV